VQGFWKPQHQDLFNTKTASYDFSTISLRTRVFLLPLLVSHLRSLTCLNSRRAEVTNDNRNHDQHARRKGAAGRLGLQYHAAAEYICYTYLLHKYVPVWPVGFFDTDGCGSSKSAMGQGLWSIALR
jgi:hypothetical protein